MTTDSGRGATPFRIPVNGYMEQDLDELRANVLANASYPRATSVSGPLAICGGGPSLGDSLNALRAWEGPVWAVNRTPGWLRDHGISSVLVSVDASPNPGAFCEPEAVDQAIFSSWCNPAVMARYSGVSVVDMYPLFPKGIVGTTTTAGCMALAALRLGCRDVTLFGCEGSFTESDHVDRHEGQKGQFIIRADGAEWVTTPDLLIQCNELSQLIRDIPQCLNEQSGGLLRAMVADPDWETVAVSGPLKDQLESAGMTGFFPRKAA